VGNELGVDPAVILQTSHGRRSIDVLKVISPAQANWECMSPPPFVLHHSALPNFLSLHALLQAV
jgi:hypothetical protein